MAIVSKESIASAASIILGGDPISDLDSGTREAQVLGGLIDFTFEALLEKTTWNFAIKEEQLSVLAGSHNNRKFQYRLQLPLDFRKVITLSNFGGTEIINYAVEGNYVYCDYDEVSLKFIYLPEVYDFSGAFKDLFVHELAANACEALTGISTLGDRMANLAAQKYKQARIVDAGGDADATYLYPGTIIIERY